jgi:hypothetical protein
MNNMKKNPIGALLISSAIIWAAVIIGCAFVLKGTSYKDKVTLILIGGMAAHLIVVYFPLGKRLNKQ